MPHPDSKQIAINKLITLLLRYAFVNAWNTSPTDNNPQEDIQLLKSCLKRLKHFDSFEGDVDRPSSLDAWIYEIGFRCDAHLTADDDPKLTMLGYSSGDQKVIDYKLIMREQVIIAYKAMLFMDDNQMIVNNKCVYKKQVKQILDILSLVCDFTKLRV